MSFKKIAKEGEDEPCYELQTLRLELDADPKDAFNATCKTITKSRLRDEFIRDDNEKVSVGVRIYNFVELMGLILLRKLVN